MYMYICLSFTDTPTPAISPAYFHCVGVSVNLGHIHIFHMPHVPHTHNIKAIHTCYLLFVYDIIFCKRTTSEFQLSNHQKTKPNQTTTDCHFVGTHVASLLRRLRLPDLLLASGQTQEVSRQCAPCAGHHPCQHAKGDQDGRKVGRRHRFPLRLPANSHWQVSCCLFFWLYFFFLLLTFAFCFCF